MRKPWVWEGPVSFVCEPHEDSCIILGSTNPFDKQFPYTLRGALKKEVGIPSCIGWENLSELKKKYYRITVEEIEQS